MASPVTVKVSANYKRWIAGFAHLDQEAAEAAQTAWEAATDVFFDRSQQYVHVLSGDLKRSGQAEVQVTKGSLVGRLSYGNDGDVDYAIYEEERGGTHAYLTRAWEATEAQFSRAFPEAWGKVVAGWK